VSNVDPTPVRIQQDMGPGRQREVDTHAQRCRRDSPLVDGNGGVGDENQFKGILAVAYAF